ncbi:MAG: LysR family transcriptional regulator [Leptolyngbya sp. SIO4C1]|nr:LysR family transcriptional regulator [Leptolyngbya sp. SIO4C1]
MTLGKIKLAQLRALATVAQTGNFSEAALQLGLSQSTVSHSIAVLEEELGIVLLNRGRYGAALTPVGEQICAKAEQVLQLVDEIAQEAAQAKGIEGGLVRIVAFRSMASNVLPLAIAKLHETYPSINVTITELDEFQQLQQALLEGKADLSVAELLPDEAFDTLPVLEDPIAALLPPGCPLEVSQLSWQHLYQYPLVTSVHSSCTVRIDHALKQAVPPIEVTYRLRTDSTIVGMVRQGLGIAIMHRLAAEPVPSDVRVVALPFTFSRWLGASWHKDALLSPAVYAFLDALKTIRPLEYKVAS